MADEKQYVINAPYISVEILQVTGGRSPKTEKKIKISGAVDELNVPSLQKQLKELFEMIAKQLEDSE